MNGQCTHVLRKDAGYHRLALTEAPIEIVDRLIRGRPDDQLYRQQISADVVTAYHNHALLMDSIDIQIELHFVPFEQPRTKSRQYDGRPR